MLAIGAERGVRYPITVPENGVAGGGIEGVRQPKPGGRIPRGRQDQAAIRAEFRAAHTILVIQVRANSATS